MQFFPSVSLGHNSCCIQGDQVLWTYLKMSDSTPRSTRSRGLHSSEATPVSVEAAKAVHGRPKKHPRLETVDEANSEVLSPENPLAASHYGAAPFRSNCPNLNALAGLSGSSNLSTVGKKTRSAAKATNSPIAVDPSNTSDADRSDSDLIDNSNIIDNSSASGSTIVPPVSQHTYAGLSQTLLHLAATHKIQELSKFAEHYTSCEYYAGITDYLQEWDYSNALYAFIDRKCCDIINVTCHGKSKKIFKAGDTMEWDVGSQVFSVCVPCFRAGRVPTRCIFLRKVGFVNHRRVNVLDRSATSFERCMEPSEDVGPSESYPTLLSKFCCPQQLSCIPMK